MARVVINDTSLIAIGDAIRAKTESSDTYKLSEMPSAIRGIMTGFSLAQPLTTDGYLFSNNGWNHLLYLFSFEGEGCISSGDYLFYNSNELTTIPCELALKHAGGVDSNINLRSHIFEGCTKLEEVPVIRSTDGTPLKLNLSYAFSNCYCLKQAPNLDGWRCGYKNNLQYAFSNCYDMKGVLDFQQYMSDVQNLNNPVANAAYAASLKYSSAFYNCYRLDEILNIRMPRRAAGVGSFTEDFSSAFSSSTFFQCCRLKRLTFEGPAVGWSKGITIDLSQYVGYVPSGISSSFDDDAGKQVTDDTTYQVLKDDPDWWTLDVNYSRYNHDSAVETINSLPDVYTRSSTIKFKGESGALTDGGAINTMTEEEIAVATAKGWTVSFV